VEHPLIKNLLFTKSIKFRVTLFTLGIFILSLWMLSFFANRTLQDDVEQLVGHQQFTTAHMVADKVNEQLLNRISALQSVANMVNPAILTNRSELQVFLEHQSILPILFNAGTFITDTHGTAQASLPVSVQRLGRNYLDLPHIAAVLKDGKARISAPLIGKQLKTPVFHIVVPIRSPQGEIIGSLVGAIDLSRPSFLDNITNSPYGKTGGYLLINAATRTIITATDKSRIMEVLVPGFNPLLDRIILGMEETGVAINTKRIEVLISGHNIPVANWRIVVALPTKEAFAPIKEMQMRMLFVTLAITLLVGSLSWWILRRELSPLLDTAHTLGNIPASGLLDQPLSIVRKDEVGELISGFNRLLDTLSERQAALAESEERFRSFANAAPTLIWVAGTDKLCNWFNHTWLQYTGRSMEEEYGNGWAEGVHSDDLDRCLEIYLSHFDARQPFQMEYRLRGHDGEYRWFIDVGHPRFDQQGQFAGYIGMLTDISERKQLEDQVRQLAYFDPLTNLPNRRLFSDRFTQVMATSKRTGEYGALMFLDLDHFKPLNDTYGHNVGDLLLIEAANRLINCIREMDTVARFGGDEFIVLLGALNKDESTSRAQAAIIAQKILVTLSEPYLFTIRHEGQDDKIIEHHCTASIGVVVFNGNEETQDDLMKLADAAMYEAKETGRNQVRFYGEQEKTT